MRIARINRNSGEIVFEHISVDHKHSCQKCFEPSSLEKTGIRACSEKRSHFYVEEIFGEEQLVHAVCLEGQKRSKHAKQVAQLLCAGVNGIFDIKVQRTSSLASASTVAVHNTRNITASINAKILNLLDEERLASAKDKVDYIERQLGYRPHEFAREILSILKAITQANFEYSILDYLSGSTPLTQQDFGTHKVHTLCALCFYLYDVEFNKRSIRVLIGKSHQSCSVNYESAKTILGQLFENALKYAASQTDIHVSFPNEDPNFISIEMKMTSLAFKNSEISNLLKIGGRGKEADKHKFEGKGIGLGMVKRLVDLNYGNINIYSDETTFREINGVLYSDNLFMVSFQRKLNYVIESIRERTRS